MQPLPRGQWTVKEVFFLHLFVLWSGCIQRNLLPKSQRLMLQEGPEATEQEPVLEALFCVCNRDRVKGDFAGAAAGPAVGVSVWTAWSIHTVES